MHRIGSLSSSRWTVPPTAPELAAKAWDSSNTTIAGRALHHPTHRSPAQTGSFGLSTPSGPASKLLIGGFLPIIEADMQSHPTLLRATPASDALQAHHQFLLGLRDLYAANVVWVAQARDIRHVGRDEVIRHLLREASGMIEPEYSFLRRSLSERQIIDEYAVRFVYSGSGMERAPVHAGDFVELKRVRILDLSAGKATLETCIENWTVLLPADSAKP